MSAEAILEEISKLPEEEQKDICLQIAKKFTGEDIFEKEEETKREQPKGSRLTPEERQQAAEATRALLTSGALVGAPEFDFENPDGE